ncbi:gliding motility-associated C-terminal domain-containing protein [Fluviicola sp.]|uniref:T9SS type B sorting domain-containing protein n=1 Tax=Fluviicola sp. TaxID=1917219 RepID=UPI003D2C04A8
MIEKDNIQELFSKAFENQTSAVRPELWAGVQAKMAAAGVASTATVATKGLSALTKWIIGSAAVGTVGVVTAVVALNSGEEPTKTKNDSPKEISQNVNVTSPEEKMTEQSVNKGEKTYSAQPEGSHSTELTKDIPFTNPFVAPPVHDQNENALIDKKESPKSDDKGILTDNSKAGSADKNDTKKSPADKKDHTNEAVTETPVKHPENIKEPVFVKLESKVTKFPNVFTPNGDRSNDIYFVEAENINDFQLVIIDQNNREMFRSGTPGEQEGWNGRDKSGDEAPNGSYAAIVTGKDQNGKSFRDIQLFELRR